MNARIFCPQIDQRSFSFAIRGRGNAALRYHMGFAEVDINLFEECVALRGIDVGAELRGEANRVPTRFHLEIRSIGVA